MRSPVSSSGINMHLHMHRKVTTCDRIAPLAAGNANKSEQRWKQWSRLYKLQPESM